MRTGLRAGWKLATRRRREYIAQKKASRRVHRRRQFPGCILLCPKYSGSHSPTSNPSFARDREECMFGRWRCHIRCNMERLFVSLPCTRDPIKSFEITHKPPVAKRTSSDAFCILGIWRGTTTPMGRRRMTTSIRMLAILSVIINDTLSTHWPLIERSHCAEIGRQRKMLMRM